MVRHIATEIRVSTGYLVDILGIASHLTDIQLKLKNLK